MAVFTRNKKMHNMDKTSSYNVLIIVIAFYIFEDFKVFNLLILHIMVIYLNISLWRLLIFILYGRNSESLMKVNTDQVQYNWCNITFNLISFIRYCISVLSLRDPLSRIIDMYFKRKLKYLYI
jgi:hypothetical protein